MVQVIKNGSTTKNYWLDIWTHRELLFFLTWRDLLVRYKQTVIGVSWVLIRPLLTMLILSVVFGRIANLPSDNMPYALLVFTGLLPWFFFANALAECSNSLITNAPLISKVYFPRIFVPASTILSSMVDFTISMLALFVLMIWFDVEPTWNLLFIFPLVLLVASLVLGMGLWFASLNVKYRDFRHLVPFMLQLGIYASPVGYSTTLIPENWQYLYYINPLAGIIDGFRWAILGSDIDLYGIGISLIMSILFLTSGIVYFRKTESTFADNI